MIWVLPNLPIFLSINLRSKVIILVTLTFESVFNPVTSKSLSDLKIANSLALILLIFWEKIKHNVISSIVVLTAKTKAGRSLV